MFSRHGLENKDCTYHLEISMVYSRPVIKYLSTRVVGQTRPFEK